MFYIFHLLPFQNLRDEGGRRMPSGAEVYAAVWGESGAFAASSRSGDEAPEASAAVVSGDEDGER